MATRFDTMLPCGLSTDFLPIFHGYDRIDKKFDHLRDDRMHSWGQLGQFRIASSARSMMKWAVHGSDHDRDSIFSEAEC
jgi:hypothetical protein